MNLVEQFNSIEDDFFYNTGECIKIANNFAIEFHRWMCKNDTPENADRWFHYSDEDMLNAFKEEKGY